jgi:MOSC domain-containing protein YiiM
VTVIASEQWDDVCRELGAELDWTLRRANLLLHGVPLREATGRRLRIADALLEITGETVPCQRMDQNYNGLMTALASDWRGGVTCRVIKGGTVTVGDSAAIEDRPATQT